MPEQNNTTNSLAHTKWNCKYHIVFAPKYRRKIFFEEKRMEIREIFRKLCQWKGVEVIEGEICPDHIHMLVSIPPKMSVAGFMAGTGGTALVSKIVGEGDREKANRYFTMVILFAVLFGLVLTAVGIAVMRPVARLLGANDEMIETCVLYGRIVVGFTTFYMLQNIFQNFLAAAEKPKLGLAVTAIAATVFFIVKRKKYGYA